MRDVSIINALTVPDWDKMVTALPEYTVFHSAGWARVLADTYNFKPVYAAVFDGDRLMAVHPCMEISSWLTGKRGVCLPFTDLCSPLLKDSVSANELMKTLLDVGRHRSWRWVEFRDCDLYHVDAQPSVQFYSHRLDLRPGETRVFQSFDSSVRRAIRKASKSKLNVTIGQDIALVRDYYKLHCRTRRRHGLPPQPWSFFLNLHRNIIGNGSGFVVLAKTDNGRGEPVAGVVILRFGEHAFYKYGASDMNRQDVRGSNFVMWHAILRCIELGCTTLDFGRTSIDDEGLRRFKLGWGTTEKRVGYLKYDFRREKFVSDRDRSQGWYNRIFRAAPVPLSRFVGAVMYRHIG